MQALQEHYVFSKDEDIKPLRIAQATVTAETAPDIYETGHGAIIITKGNAFTALVTDGTTLTT